MTDAVADVLPAMSITCTWFMALNVAQKLLRSHLADGDRRPGAKIGLRIDQTLTQDATGTMVMLELEALVAVHLAESGDPWAGMTSHRHGRADG